MGSREEEEGQERDGKGERVENEKLRLQKVCDGDNSNKDMKLGGNLIISVNLNAYSIKKFHRFSGFPLKYSTDFQAFH